MCVDVYSEMKRRAACVRRKYIWDLPAATASQPEV